MALRGVMARRRSEGQGSGAHEHREVSRHCAPLPPTQAGAHRAHSCTTRRPRRYQLNRRSVEPAALSGSAWNRSRPACVGDREGGQAQGWVGRPGSRWLTQTRQPAASSQQKATHTPYSSLTTPKSSPSHSSMRTVPREPSTTTPTSPTTQGCRSACVVAEQRCTHCHWRWSSATGWNGRLQRRSLQTPGQSSRPTAPPRPNATPAGAAPL